MDPAKDKAAAAGGTPPLPPLSVAYFGAETSFTHQAALRQFGTHVTALSMATIADVFDAVEQGKVHEGVVPVENSTEGAITVTFDLFSDKAVTIAAEVYMRIHHHLLANGPLEAITVVYSHPQVFGQCRRWLQQHLPGRSLVEVGSTPLAAARAAAEPNAAALAGTLAADKHGLKVLHRNIEDSTENTTRFLVLSKQAPLPTGDDKTSLMFGVEDRVGALYDALVPFKENGVNLSMILSRPSRKRTWDYVFFVDFQGHIHDAASQRAVEGLRRHCRSVKHLGSYPRAAGKG